MRRRIQTALAVVLLLSLTLSIVPNCWSNDLFPVANSVRSLPKLGLTYGMIVTEDIYCNEDGSCSLQLDIAVTEPHLNATFGKALGYDSAGDPVQDIPDYVAFDWYPTALNTDVSENHLTVEGPENGIPVREPFLEALIQEHRYSLGIYILSISTASMESDVTGFAVHVEAEALCQSIYRYGSNRTELFIGPMDYEASFARAGFIMGKIGFIQKMLENFTQQQYSSVWTTNVYPPPGVTLTNAEELELMAPWDVDFGPDPVYNKTYMLAQITQVIDTFNPCITFTDELHVSNQNITKTDEQLLEDELLDYKIFKIIYSTGAQPPPQDENVSAVGIDNDWSCRWSLKLWDGSYSLPFSIETAQGNIDGSFNIASKMELLGYIGWEHKWFKLKEFTAWMAIKPTFTVGIEIEECYLDLVSFDYELFSWKSKEFYFWIGPIPVMYQIIFDATFSFEIQGGGELDDPLSWELNATGMAKAGVSWKRHRGWRPIFDADMNVEMTQEPASGVSFFVRLTPQLKFTLKLMFYKITGPYIEFGPYAALTIYDSGSWNVGVGIDVWTGISFAGWIEKLLRLRSVGFQLANIILWQYPDPDYDHDAAVIDIRAPEKAFVGNDYIDVLVDVINNGTESKTINVTLYCRLLGESEWTAIGDPLYIDLDPYQYGTLEFTCYTGDMTAGTYTISANATIADEEYPDNNYALTEFELDIEDVAITSLEVTPIVLPPGNQINVTVENQGTCDINSTCVFLFYENEPIGDLWCEYMRVKFDLAEGANTILTFEHEELGTTPSNYAALALQLPHETEVQDNCYPQSSEPDLDIAVDDVSPFKTIVGQGFSLYVNVTVTNQGTYAETLVTLYANTTVAGQMQANLPAGESITITLTLNTDASTLTRGDYFISAYAIPVPGEANTSNNNFTGGVVKIGFVGDINGDDYVGIDDLFTIASHFAQDPSHPNWSPNCDVNNDYYIGIDDILEAATHFGEGDS